MNILFANGRQSPPFFQGGDGVSLHTLLAWLHRRGHRIRCLGIINPHQRVISQEEMMRTLEANKATVTTATQACFAYLLDLHYSALLVRSDLFLPTLREELTRYQPDVVLTQLEESHTVIPLASALSLPVIHFVHDTHPLNSRALACSAHISKVLFNSYFTATTYRDILQCPFEILYPPIESTLYQAEERLPATLTMINPVAHKGALLVAAFIRSLGDQPFLLVPGWQPIEVEAEGMSNVTVLSRQSPATMRQVYAQTKILLVPSQYEETFGRVAIEALINGIPVIASKVGGLAEAVGPGGILVSEY
jgi:glycosyltransferase involved in cell wall biosynthesis